MRWLLSGFVGLALIGCAMRNASAQAAPSVDRTSALTVGSVALADRAERSADPILADRRSELLPADLTPSESKTPQPKTPIYRELFSREAGELELALGRIQLNSQHFRVMRKHESFDDGGERSYQVSIHEGSPTLRVVYRDQHEDWLLHCDFHEGTTWTRSFDFDSGRATVEYTQLRNRPIAITVTQDNLKDPKQGTKKWSGQSLWHMLQLHDPDFDRIVKPSLMRLNADWKLDETLAAADRILAVSSSKNSESAEVVVARCLRELESPESSRRLEAAATLRGLGLAAQIPLSRSVAGGKLTPHQRDAVNKLLDALQPQSPDTPTRLAYWLSGDPSRR